MTTNVLVPLLLLDLKTLKEESKRKFPVIRDATEKSIAALSALPPNMDPSPILKSEDTWKPFLMACETKNRNMVVASLATLQKLLSHDVIGQGAASNIITTLTRIADATDEGLQLKLLQTLLTLLTSTHYELPSSQLGSALSLCFTTLCSKSSNVSNTATATIKQVCTLLFERLGASGQPTSPTHVRQPSHSRTSSSHSTDRADGDHHMEDSEYPNLKNAFLLFKDLVIIADGEAPQWLRLAAAALATPSLQLLVLDLIHACLLNDASIVSSNESFMAFITSRMPATLGRAMKTQMDFGHMIRIYRIVGTIIRSYPGVLEGQCEQFLSQMTKQVKEGSLPTRLVVLSVWRDWATDRAFLRRLFEEFDQRAGCPHMFAQLVGSVGKVITALYQNLELEARAPGGSGGTSSSAAGSAVPGSPVMPLLSLRASRANLVRLEAFLQEPEAIKMPEVIVLAIDTLAGIVNSLTQLSDEDRGSWWSSGGATATVAAGPATDGTVNARGGSRGGPLSTSGAMADSVWCSTLSPLTFLLTKSNDEEIIQTTLRCYQQFIHTCGLASLSTPRDAFITSLTKHAMPPPTPAGNAAAGGGAPSMTPKNILVWKVMFNVANGLGTVLGSSWYLVLTNFQQLDAFLAGSNDPTAGALSPTSPSSHGAEQSIQSDLLVMQSLLVSLFESTKYLDIASLQCLLTALIDLSNEAFSSGTDMSFMSSRQRLFGCSKIVEVLRVNTFRLHLLSGVMYNYFVSPMLILSPDPNIRRFVLDSCTTIILAFLTTSNPSAMASTSSIPSDTCASPVPALRLSHMRIPSDSESSEVNAPSSMAHAAPVLPGANHQELQRELSKQAADGQLQRENTQLRLLTMLDDMFNFEKQQGNDTAFEPPVPSDLRYHLLNSLHRIVENAGEELLQSAWKIVLIMLNHCITGSKEETTSAFKIVSFICNDFLHLIGPDRLQQLISVVGAYARLCTPDDNININLSAIQLLMSIADHAASQSPQGVVTVEHWNTLLIQLRDSALDSRPEIRNSALKTLFSIVVHTGKSLPTAAWPFVFWHVLVRILDGISLSAVSANDEVTAPTVGPGGTAIMVHHSRNSQTKLWNETRCTVLDGVVRVVRIFLTTVKENVTKLSELEKRVAHHLADAAVNPNEEVSICGIKGFHDILTSYENYPEDFPQVVWDSAWTSWDALSDLAANDDTGSRAKSLVILVEGITDMHTAGNYPAVVSRFSVTHTTRLLAILRSLMHCAAARESFLFPSRLQTAVVRCMELLPLPADADLSVWFQVLDVYESFLPSADTIQSCLGQFPLATSANANGQRRKPNKGMTTEAETLLLNTAHPDFAREVMTSLQTFYSSPAMSATVRAALLPRLIAIFRALLLSRYVGTGAYAVWKHAIRVLRQILRAGLPVFAKVDDPSLVLSTWNSLHSTLHGFILGPSSSSKVLPAAAPALTSPIQGDPNSGEATDAATAAAAAASDPPMPLNADEEELIVMEMLRDDILPCCVPTVPDTLCAQLLLIISGASKVRDKRILSDAAINTLFYLCQRVMGKNDFSPNYRIGVLTLPILLNRCKGILQDYLRDDRNSGRCPLPRHRHEEVAYVLRQLKTLELEPQLFTTVQWDGASGVSEEKCPAAYSRRGLVIRLFPVLLEFVACRDDHFRGALLDLFRIVASEFNLPLEAVASASSQPPSPAPSTPSAAPGSFHSRGSPPTASSPDRQPLRPVMRSSSTASIPASPAPTT